MSTVSPKEKNLLLVTVVVVLYGFAALSFKKQVANWKVAQRVYATAQKELSEENALIAARDDWSARYEQVRELMPVFRLHKIFGVKDAMEDLFGGLLVVVEDRGKHCALLVDELLGQQQVGAKAIKSGVEKTQGVSGGAILGDGRVGLILDPQEVAALGRKLK